MGFLHRIKDSNFAHATSSFLIELHEAQCFFVLAISIASLYAQNQPADFNGADSWESLLQNQILLVQLTNRAIFPIFLVELMLPWFTDSMASVYSLSCSTLAVTMAGVTLTQLTDFDTDRVHRMFSGDEGLEECGGRPSLRTFCLHTACILHWTGTGRQLDSCYPGLRSLGSCGASRLHLSWTQRRRLEGERASSKTCLAYGDEPRLASGHRLFFPALSW